MRIVRTTRAACAVAATVILSGCASIISDSHYPVSFTSQPAGATFSVRNESGVVVHQGVTPGTVTLKAGDGYFSGAHYTVAFSKEGYEGQTNTISPSVDGWYVANILFGGVIGLLIIDPATGAMYKLPESSSAHLTQLAVIPPTEREEVIESVDVVSINTLSDVQKQQLIRIN
ncbi:hypothetical protein [Halopseudomonas bauzanensis]|uniref:hypothetical protein n=1 Tax=Halopseudomonas bauzanensis TaxID=653930 RepID=UPI0025564B52|nr:hypothetical protein [Halopseudomonas bauzanensis]